LRGERQLPDDEAIRAPRLPAGDNFNRELLFLTQLPRLTRHQLTGFFNSSHQGLLSQPDELMAL
jgi:hypothetical protein